MQKITIPDTIKNTLLDINWLSRTGAGSSDRDVVTLSTVSVASRHLESPEWEDVTLQAANEITARLSVNNHRDFHHWNTYAQEAREFVETHILPELPDVHGFDSKLIIQCVSWDTVHFIMERIYRRGLRPPFFYENLIQVYQSGHLPCGWEGRWPDGKLKVY
ncbi:hypothetical protein [Sinomicrobium sp. M5D2P17]